MKCGDKSCDAEATVVYFWPGRPDPQPACLACAHKAQALGFARGYEIELAYLRVSTTLRAP